MSKLRLAVLALLLAAAVLAVIGNAPADYLESLLGTGYSTIFTA